MKKREEIEGVDVLITYTYSPEEETSAEDICIDAITIDGQDILPIIADNYLVELQESLLEHEQSKSSNWMDDCCGGLKETFGK